MASVFNLTRVFRFINPQGVPQITDFPDDPPEAPTDKQIRIKHFTEIENFAFLGYTLAHELGGPAIPISTLTGLQVPDKEFQDFVSKATLQPVTDEDLADTILDVGINWEHFVAQNEALLIPGNPLKVSDTVLQEKIDSLDFITEALVKEVNIRSLAHGKPAA